MKTFTQFLREATSINGWTKVGRQLGSNPGGQYQDTEGKKWYVKQSKSDDHAKNEMLANHLYSHLGVPTLDNHLIDVGNGRLGTASQWVDKKNFDPHNAEDVSAIRKHFASHAFVSNWDTVGLSDDNQAHTSKGMTTLDAGGSLNYRAQGEPKGKLFGDKVIEWDGLRNPDINPEASRIFGGMKPHEMVDSARAVAKLPNKTISDLVSEHGPGSEQDKAVLTNKLHNRKKDIIMRANELAAKHNLEPVKDIDDEKL